MQDSATPTPTLAQTLEQKRARYALAAIRAYTVDGVPEEDARKYATLVRSLPAMVLSNGLGQALAYLLADAERDRGKPSYKLYDQLQSWLVGGRDDAYRERVFGTGQLIDVLMEGSRGEYQRAEAGALRLLAWMRKFADAYLPKGER